MANKTTVPTTFQGRKQMERAAFRLAEKAFARSGWTLVPLALERSEFIFLDSILSLPLYPPQVIFLLSLPDCVAFSEAVGQALCVELKATQRPTFSIRCRDFIALWAWRALIVVAHLPTGELRASHVSEFPEPECVIAPDEPRNVFDSSGLDWMLKQYPDARFIAGCAVEAGSRAPFAVWKFDQLEPLDKILLRGDL